MSYCYWYLIVVCWATHIGQMLYEDLNKDDMKNNPSVTKRFDQPM